MTLARIPAPAGTPVSTHHHHRRRGLGAWRGPVTGVAAALVVVLAGLGGYAVGSSGKRSDKEAKAAKRAAARRAYVEGRREVIARGRSAGTRAGQADGAAAGARAARRAAVKPAKPAITSPGAVKDCKTFIKKKTFISSVKGISCGAAAAEEGKAMKAGHANRTPKGFVCQQVVPNQYRCTHGAQAYRWNIAP